jgi:hypothetical protein
MIYSEEAKRIYILVNNQQPAYQSPFPSIGNEIEYRGLTLHQLASRLGLSDQDIVDVFEGKRSDPIPPWSSSIIPIQG